MDRQDERGGDSGFDGRVSQAHFALCAGRGSLAARRGRSAREIQWKCEGRKRDEVYARADGLAGQGTLLGAVREISGRLSGSESVAAGTCCRWGGRVQQRGEVGRAERHLTRKDDAGARVGAGGAAGAGLSGVYDSEGAPVSFGALERRLALWRSLPIDRGFERNRLVSTVMMVRWPLCKPKSWKKNSLCACLMFGGGSLFWAIIYLTRPSSRWKMALARLVKSRVVLLALTVGEY